MYTLSVGVGYMVGPAMGGWLFELSGGPRLPLLANAAVVVGLIPLVGAVVKRYIPDDRSDGDDGGEGGEGGEGGGGGGGGVGGVGGFADSEEDGGGSEGGGGSVNVLRMASRPSFLAVAMLLLALSVSFGMFPSTLPPHLQRTLHVSAGGVGSVYAVVAVRGGRPARLHHPRTPRTTHIFGQTSSCLLHHLLTTTIIAVTKTSCFLLYCEYQYLDLQSKTLINILYKPKTYRRAYCE